MRFLEAPGQGCGGVTRVVESATFGGVIEQFDGVVVVGCGVDEPLSQGEPGGLVGNTGDEQFGVGSDGVDGLGWEDVFPGEFGASSSRSRACCRST